MASRDQRLMLKKTKKMLGSKTITPTSSAFINKKNPKPRSALLFKEQSLSAYSTTRSKIHKSTVNRVNQLSQRQYKLHNPEVPRVIRKKIIPSVRLSRNRTASTKTIDSSETSTPLPKLRMIVDQMTSFVKIDHEKVYPLLGILVNYAQETSLVDRVERKSLLFSPQEIESLPKEFNDTSKRFERQRIMDSLISPRIMLYNNEKRNYDDNTVKYRLNDLLPILRRCKGDVNYSDKNGRTILHTFIKKYVVTHQILREQDLLKPEYKNSPQLYFRQATFHAIESLLKKGASVDIADNQGKTPLHILLEYDGYEEIARLLLNRLAVIDSCDNNGDTILHLMIGNLKNLRNIDFLVAKGADMHKMNKNGKAPIHIACEHCQIEVLDVFERAGANFNLKTKDKKTLLHLVCQSSTRSDAQKMMTIDRLIGKVNDIDAVDIEGYSALHYAVKFSGRAIIERLINLGADVFRQTKKMRLTPLHLASQFGRRDAINILIQAGVDVNINVAAGGLIPLHLAILHNHDTLTIEYLVANGADLNRRDAIFNFTPIHMTAFTRSREKPELLTKINANVENRMGITPLHLASMLGNLEVLEGLCQRDDVDVNRRDKLFGMTALHWASMKGKQLDLNRLVDGVEDSMEELAIVQFWKPLFLRFCQHCDNHDNMIDSHVSPNIRTILKNNSSIESVICLHPTSQTIRLLLKFGAYAEMQDYEGRTAACNVIRNNNVEGMKHLINYGLDINESEISHRIIDTWTNMKVRSYVLWNVMKLRLAGLPIADEYVSIVMKPIFQRYHGCLEDEVKGLKRYKVDDGLSLYELMRMEVKKRFQYVRRMSLLQRDMEVKFPNYHFLLLNSCRQAVVRINLEVMAKLTLRRMQARLTDACCERVFLLLSCIDLRAFVDGLAASVEDV